MKDLDKKIVSLVHALFGAFLGFLVFTFALGGWRFVFTGRSQSTWRGPFGLLICIAIGGMLGWIAYKFRSIEFDLSGSIPQDRAGAMLFTKLLMVVGVAVVGLYFIWQLAKSLR
jgi:hypothetical protein